MYEPTRDRVANLLGTFGLPLRLPQPIGVDELMHAMRYDKKATSGRLRLVVPRGLGSADVTEDVPEEVVRAAWEFVGAAG